MDALSVTVTEPVSVPEVVGANSTVILQEAPAASVELQVPNPANLKFGLMAKLLTVRAVVVELLVKVAVW